MFDDYADEDLPLGAYALIVAAFAAASGAGLASIARAEQLPERVRTGDVVLVGVAAHKLSRLIARDTVTSFLRAPFTRYQGAGGMNELDESARGQGLQRAIGELLICPPCAGLWAVAALWFAHLRAPRLGRAVTGMLAAQSVSDFLHLGYHAALKRG